MLSVAELNPTFAFSVPTLIVNVNVTVGVFVVLVIFSLLLASALAVILLIPASFISCTISVSVYNLNPGVVIVATTVLGANVVEAFALFLRYVAISSVYVPLFNAACESVISLAPTICAPDITCVPV